MPVAVAAAVASAALLAGATQVAWLAWVALVPAATVALRAAGTRAGRLAVPLAWGLAMAALLVPALPFGLADGQWGETPPPIMVAGSPVLFVVLVALPLAVAALYAVRFGSPASGAARRSGEPRGTGALRLTLAAVAVPAAAWTALELLRLGADPGGLWGPLFATQAGAPGAALAAGAGALGLTFVIVAANYALALALVAPRGPALTAAGVVVAIAGALALAGGGGNATASAGRLAVAAVQPGYDTAREDLPVLRFFEPGTYDLASLDLIEDLGSLTRRAAARGARLVVWPEAAVWAHPLRTPRVRAALQALARATRTTLVVPFWVPAEDRGATVLVEPDGRFTAIQAKQRPMWFRGEQSWPGHEPRPVAAAGTRVGTLLGVDNQAPGLPRRLAARGARLLTSSTHDWRQLAPRQRAFSQVHAEATGLPLVRADWRYGSMIVARDGRRLADAGAARRRTVLVAGVTPSDGPRGLAGPAAWPPWLTVPLALTALIGPAAAWRRRPTPRAGGRGRRGRRGAARW